MYGPYVWAVLLNVWAICMGCSLQVVLCKHPALNLYSEILNILIELTEMNL